MVITAIEVHLIYPLRYFNHIIAFVVLVKLLVFVIYRPYKTIIHNAAVLFNHGTVVFAIVWALLEQYQLIGNNISKML